MSELRELGASVGTAIPADMPLRGELMTVDRASVRGAIREVRSDAAVNLRDGVLDAVATAAPAVVDYVAEHTGAELLGATAIPLEVAHVVVATWLAEHTLAAGDANELLYAALGGPRDSVANRATAAGVGAVLLGLHPDDVEELRAGLPPAALGSFDRGVARARALEGTLGFDEAAEAYRAVQRDWADGRAAALGGWDDAGRGSAFAQARAATRAWMDANPAAAREERAEYDAGFREGFLAAEGAPDEYRERTDAAYRAGVHWRQAAESGGACTLEAERARIGGTLAGSFALCAPVRA